MARSRIGRTGKRKTIGDVLADLVKRRSSSMPTDCWIYTGYIDKDGYGSVMMNRKVYRVHCAVYEHFRGVIPEGLEIDHLCRNRACANPDHLEPVTRRINQLRGETFSALNSLKTYCPKGHSYSGENLYVDPKGGRRCITCGREDFKRYYQKAKSLGTWRQK